MQLTRLVVLSAVAASLVTACQLLIEQRVHDSDGQVNADGGTVADATTERPTAEAGALDDAQPPVTDSSGFGDGTVTSDGGPDVGPDGESVVSDAGADGTVESGATLCTPTSAGASCYEFENFLDAAAGWVCDASAELNAATCGAVPACGSKCFSISSSQALDGGAHVVALNAWPLPTGHSRVTFQFDVRGAPLEATRIVVAEFRGPSASPSTRLVIEATPGATALVQMLDATEVARAVTDAGLIDQSPSLRRVSLSADFNTRTVTLSIGGAQVQAALDFAFRLDAAAPLGFGASMGLNERSVCLTGGGVQFDNFKYSTQ